MFSRVAAQVRKEIIQIARDRLALALALLLPAFMFVLLSFAISLDVHDMPLAVQDLDRGPLALRFLDSVRASLTFHIVPLDPDHPPERAILTNRVQCALVIPEHFSRDLARGRNATVDVLVDATDSNTSALIAGSIAALARDFNRGLRPAGSNAGEIRTSTRLWFNPGRDSRKFYPAGIFVLGLSIFPAMIAVLAVAREGEQKTILQVYVSSISAHEYLLGKVLFGMIVGAAEWLALLSLAAGLFGLRFAGDAFPFLLASVLFLFCSVGFGVFIGVAIPNQAAAIQAIALFSVVLSLLMSGLIFPVANIPGPLRWICGLVPARYYIEVVRDAFLKGGGWVAMWRPIAAIAAIGAVFFSAAWLKFRKMQVESR